MKLAGTIKLEVIKPLNISWPAFRARANALSRALAPALTLTMREFYPQAIDELDARWKGEKAETDWQLKVRTSLHKQWTSQLVRLFDNDRVFAKKIKKPEPDFHAYVPVIGVQAEETTSYIVSRFTGGHLKDLLASRSSFPSFVGGKAFYCAGRACVVEGGPEDAVLCLPLWKTGRGLTTLAVAPCGGHAKALWRKLVHDFSLRAEVVSIENAIKAARGEENRKERERLIQQLESRQTMKLGRVGLKFDKKKRKWFALISWTQYRPSGYKEGATAAVNLGVNVFLQALCTDGSAWDYPGTDIRVARERFHARRKSIQQMLRFSGRGARGHGKKRLEQPLTKLRSREQDFMRTKNLVVASWLVRWCLDHGVSKLLLEDLTGIRENFEQRTEGDADTHLKRLLHSWAYYELGQAIEAQAAEFNIEVKRVKSSSTRCPECKHDEPENVQLVDRGGEYLLHPKPSREDPESVKRAKVYKSVDRGTKFECKSCGTKTKGDVATCANMLLDEVGDGGLAKAQEAARKRSRAEITTINRRADKDVN